MRDYILTESIARDSTFVFPKLRRVVRNWMFKRTLKALQQLDDHVLSDIGLSRAEVSHLTDLPLEVDLMAELGRIRDLHARHPHLLEERRHLAVKRPEAVQPPGIGLGEVRVGFDLRSHHGLVANPGGILAGRS